MQNKFDLFSSALLFFLEIFGFAFKILYLCNQYEEANN